MLSYLVVYLVLSGTVLLFNAGAAIASRGSGRRAGDVAVVVACALSLLPWEWL